MELEKGRLPVVRILGERGKKIWRKGHHQHGRTIYTKDFFFDIYVLWGFILLIELRRWKRGLEGCEKETRGSEEDMEVGKGYGRSIYRRVLFI